VKYYDTDMPDDPHYDCRQQFELMQEQLDEITNEVASVLMLMDGLAEQWGDEGVFRTCRDRLRVFVPADRQEGDGT
jgi:hypothetical protein